MNNPTTGSRHKNLILFVIILTSLINPFMGAAVNIALPRIDAEFHMGAVGISWVSMAFLLLSAVFLVPIGKIADIVGRIKVFFWGNILVALASGACALSPSGSLLIAFRAIQGIGAAMVFGTGIAIITSVFPARERGKAIGINVTAVYVGLSIAPLLGGVLTEALGWRSLFYLTAPVVLFIASVIKWSIHQDWAEASSEKLDVWGSLIYMISISAFIYGLAHLPALRFIVLTAVGLLGFVAFVMWENKTETPVFEMKLFRENRLFAFSNLAALINYATTFAITFLLSLFLQYSKGLSPRDAGLLLVIRPVVMALIASFSGRMSDTYDPRILASWGMFIILIGILLLIFMNPDAPNLYLISTLAILGVGFGLFSSPNTNAIMGSVNRNYLGVASATVSTMRIIGQMISMAIATLVLNLYLGTSTISGSTVGLFLKSMKVVFIILSILSVLGIFASLARGKTADTKQIT